MRNEKGKITFISVFKWLRTDKGKRYSFFIFYFFFFILLFIVMNIKFDDNFDNNIVNENNNISSELDFSFNNFLSDNFNFNYSIYVDNDLYEYIGSKNNDNISLTLDDVYNFSYVNKELVKTTDNSLILLEFLDIYKIENIIKKSTLYEETKILSTNEYKYVYNINSSYLIDLFMYDHLVTNDYVNEIIITTDKDKLVSKIEFNVVNYINELNSLEYNDYKIVMTYEV